MEDLKSLEFWKKETEKSILNFKEELMEKTKKKKLTKEEVNMKEVEFAKELASKLKLFKGDVTLKTYKEMQDYISDLLKKNSFLLAESEFRKQFETKKAKQKV